jgi:hypothetical protein
VIAGNDGGPTEVQQGSLAQRVRELELLGEDRKVAMKQAAKEFGVTRSEAYRQLHWTPNQNKKAGI